MKTNTRQYDVVIVGGGMVGATLACALGDSLLRVALIEPQPVQMEWPETGYDLRVSAITRASRNIFIGVGAWEGICAHRVSPFREMHVWDATGSGVIHFDSAELGEPTLGYIIENRVILATLYERLRAFKNVELIQYQQCTELTMAAENASIKLQDGTIITTRLLVGADGSRSWVRQRSGITTRGWDYAQAALVTYIKTERPHQETAWQRFMPDGPLAFLPLTEGYSSIVWSTTPAHAQQLQAMEEAAFCQELGQAFDYTLGEVLCAGPRAIFPLRFMVTEEYVRARLALVGDAAHTIHPLAGQGVNLGLADAASLAELLLGAHSKGKDIGALRSLRAYERWRKAENFSMLVAMDGFQRLFSSELPSLRWLRNTGINLTNALPPVKHRIIQQAMGLEGDLPAMAVGQRDAGRLARGEGSLQ